VTTALLSVGSNLGDRLGNCQAVTHQLHRVPGVEVVEASVVYETQPVGMAPGTPWFMNVVLQVETSLSAEYLLAACLTIEQALGRERQPGGTGLSQNRTVDCDLLFYGQNIHQTDPAIQVPHPRLHERAFVLVPLLELAPDWVHPVLGLTVEQLYFNLPHPETVRVAGMLDDWR
jgi:2-amino-4-hydroxy-6-hydroxymethyldihydropteridine diphosphokinase